MLSELKRPFCGKYIVIVFSSPHAIVDWKASLKIESRKLVRGDDFIPIEHRTDRAAGHRLQSPSEAGHLPTIDAILSSIGAVPNQFHSGLTLSKYKFSSLLVLRL
ncbi:hypothetical protein QCA50_019660 [Cerrena zonata]|uniref:Uncharacterized protein n=1 Tax=Cerrena zonata TaxID=2478898 RepID=A0AAW0FE55_9APHY